MESFTTLGYPSPSATPGNPRPPKPLRLRLACDACTTSKVKCSKTHPCERCLDNDEECQYSASRRHGKRSRHNKTEAEARHTPPSSCIIASPGFSTPISGVDGQTMLYDPDFTFVGGTVGSTPALPDDWTGHGMDVSFGLDVAALYNPDSEEWKVPDLISQANQGQPGDSTAPDAQQQEVLVTDHIASHSRPTMPAGTTRYSSGKDQGVRQAHDCETVALHILNSLHDSLRLKDTEDNICKAGTHDAADDTTLARSASLGYVPSIDVVLGANQTALTSLHPLLKCPCARSPHIALLHSSILSKVIFWYRMAVTGRSHAEGVKPNPMKIQLGMLDLDDDDRETVQHAVLLSELRKVERVVVSIEKEGPTWQGLAIQKMREELQSIVGKIKRRQSEWIQGG